MGHSLVIGFSELAIAFPTSHQNSKSLNMGCDGDFTLFIHYELAAYCRMSSLILGVSATAFTIRGENVWWEFQSTLDPIPYTTSLDNGGVWIL